MVELRKRDGLQKCKSFSELRFEAKKRYSFFLRKIGFEITEKKKWWKQKSFKNKIR